MKDAAMIIGIDPAKPGSEATGVAYLIPNIMDQYSKTPLRPWLDAGKLPSMFMPTDPPWMPGGADQAVSRLHRKRKPVETVTVKPDDVMTTSKMLVTKRPPVNPWPDVAAMTGLLDAMSLKKYQQLYLQDWSRDSVMAQRFPQNLRLRDPARPNFVGAFLKAAERWSQRINMSLLVTPSQAIDYEPEFIQDWIWGPNGEFTGFARINLMDDAEQVFRYEAPSTHGTDYQVRDIRDVNFKLHLIRRRYRSAGYDPLYDLGGGGRRGYQRDLEDTGYMRFATYGDYVRWDAWAARDDYSHMEVARVERYG
jgi:hypothetical protein